VQILLFSYVRGVASAFESEAEGRRETGMSEEEWLLSQYALFTGVLARHDRPRIRALTEAGGGFDFDLEKLFRFGLGRLLDGLEVFVDRKV
jgi:hypothetical protein